MKSHSIPITRPCFDQREIQSLGRVIRSGWVTQGSQVRKLEKEFAHYVGTNYALATSSCTSALHLCLIAAGIGKGDEVIVPAFTFVATANAIEYVGARPVFCDIDTRTFNIDAGQIEKKITPKTRAVIPVHLFGLICDIDPVLGIGERHNLAVIEDAACAVGSIRNARMAGSFGKFGCFSFHPRKIMVTGEGGMITFNKKSFKKVLEALRSHGANPSDYDVHSRRAFKTVNYNLLGYNYRMTDMQAAIGLEQLKKVESFIKRRAVLANRYSNLLGGLGYLKLPFTPKGCRHTYQAYVVSIDERCPVKRDEIMLRLSKSGVMTQIGTYAVHLQGYYRRKYGLRPTDYPNSFKAQRQSLTLPLYPRMNLEEQSYVIGSLKDILK